MKKLLLIITILFASYIIDAQTINLVKDESYAVGGDWAKICDNAKKLTVFDDGTAMISHTNENRYSLFDKNGKLLKDIKIYFEDGKKKPFNLQPVLGKINNLYFTGTNSQGIIYFFNDNGLIVNEIIVDFSSHEMIPLANDKIALFGGTSWETQWHYFVAILDIGTGDYHIVYDDFEETTSIGGEYMIYAKALINHRVDMVKISDNVLAIALPDAGKLLLYNITESSLIEKKLDWQPKVLSVEEQKKMQSDAIEKYKKEFDIWQKYPNPEKLAEKQQQFVKQLENGMNHITEPLTVSWFTSAIKGNGDNIIFFEYIDEAGKNSFHAYSVGQNKTISKNSFQCTDYDLSIKKNKFVIHNGYVYGIQNVKGSENDLRLVRFEMK